MTPNPSLEWTRSGMAPLSSNVSPASMTVRPVSAWLPIRTPEWDHPDRLPIYLQCRDEFMRQLPHAIAASGKGVTIQSVELADPPARLLPWFKEKNFMVATRLSEFIHIKGEALIDEKWLRDNPGIEEIYIKAVAGHELQRALELVLLLSELAYPGCIDTFDGAILSDDVFVSTLAEKGSHTRLRFPDEDVLWPVIEQHQLIDVVRWARRTNVIHGHLAETRVERALAAYSHVIGLSWMRDGELLFRAMQGLEAFYIDGIGDLRRQLSQKAQIWLGPWDGNKNVVGHLYDLRSAFVHGSSKLVYWGRDGGAWDEDEAGMAKFEGSVNLAVRLLVASLQKCIRQDVTEVEWSYVVAAS